MSASNYRNQRRDQFLAAQKVAEVNRLVILRYMQNWNLKRGRELLWPRGPHTSR